MAPIEHPLICRDSTSMSLTTNRNNTCLADLHPTCISTAKATVNGCLVSWLPAYHGAEGKTGVPMQLLETAAGKASGDVGKQFDAAIANNLTTVRMFGFGTMGGFPLQSGIGSYNEQAFQAFDKVFIAEATMIRNTRCMRLANVSLNAMAALVTCG